MFQHSCFRKIKYSTFKNATRFSNLFILFIYFISKFSMQQYNSKIVKYTIQFMHTWILKDEQVATYIAP